MSQDQKPDTICCQEFNPALWDNKFQHWDKKLFVRGNIRQIFHLPLNMGKVYPAMCAKIEAAGAMPPASEFLGLFYDPSPWKSEAYMTVTKEVPGLEKAELSGDFYSRVFDGPFRNIPKFFKEIQADVKNHQKQVGKVYFHYAYCPKCSKKYGHNYIVAFAQEN
ncbi:MAG: hydrolase [Patescibacteria group bacterium]